MAGGQGGPDKSPGEQRRETVLAGVHVRVDQQIQPGLAALRAGVQAQEPVREAQVEFGRFMVTGGAGDAGKGVGGETLARVSRAAGAIATVRLARAPLYRCCWRTREAPCKTPPPRPSPSFEGEIQRGLESGDSPTASLQPEYHEGARVPCGYINKKGNPPALPG